MVSGDPKGKMMHSLLLTCMNEKNIFHKMVLFYSLNARTDRQSFVRLNK